MYGATPDDTSPHWYDFIYDQDTATGTSVAGKVVVQAPDGSTIERQMLILQLVDGGRGDSDLTADGRILITTGGVNTQAPLETSSGSAVYLLLSMLMLITRAFLHNNKKYIF